MPRSDRPNVVFVFADQWRAQAAGYAGDPNVHTPNLDRLAGRCVRFTNAVSGFPMCSPYRASLITGRHPLTHRIVINDACLDTSAVSIAQAFAAGGYNTGYIGKWHLDGHGRKSFIPPERRQGFDFWRVLECTHDYNNSQYYGDADTLLTWDGYDAAAQTRCAADYIRQYDSDKPFLLALSWGPPHDPYDAAPSQYGAMYDPDKLILRPNVREGPWMPNLYGTMARIRADLAGYYAHCTALDDCVGSLLETLEQTGRRDNTIFVFTSDHGDMLGSQGLMRKQVFYDESVTVPLLMSWPVGLGSQARQTPVVIDAQDIMPTLLGLCGLAIPSTVEGTDFSAAAAGTAGPSDSAAAESAAVLMAIAPHVEWRREYGAREYRGVRTGRHTYVRHLDGPWVMFDNLADPYQMNNLVGQVGHAALEQRLDALLWRLLGQRGDEFKPTEYYLRKFNHPIRPGMLPPPSQE